MNSSIYRFSFLVVLVFLIQSCIGSRKTFHENSTHDCSHSIPSGIKNNDEAVKIALDYIHTWNITSIFEDSVTVDQDSAGYYNVFFKCKNTAIRPPGVVVSIRKIDGCAHSGGLE